MPWSPATARSLPSLRPTQVSPLAASRKATDSKALPSLPPLESSKANRYQLTRRTDTQDLPESSFTHAENPSRFQLRKAKRKEVSTSHEINEKRPHKALKVPPRFPGNESEPLVAPLSLGHAPSTSPVTNQSFFSLTKQEIERLRRNMGKGSIYNGFKDVTIARELNRLDRGWDGYLRAKDKAVREGKTHEFWRHFSLELNTVLSAKHFRPGAISVESAVLAAQSNYTTSVGELRTDYKAEVQLLKAKSLPVIDGTGLVGPITESCGSETVRLPSSSPPAHGAGSEALQRGTRDSVPPSKPKRVLKRPDYMIPPLLESSPEPPSSPALPSASDGPSRTASPTPREIYDRTQPKFVQYPCEWKGCKASLNNLETFQKHIRIVHTKDTRDNLCCRWGSCDEGDLITYKSANDLLDHFATAHLMLLKQRLGDGHKSQGVMATAPSV